MGASKNLSRNLENSQFCNATLACKNINFLYNQFSRDGETLNQSIAFVTGPNMKTFRVRIVEKG